VSRYIIRRLLLLLPMLIGLSVLVFAIMHSLPGDPAAALLGPNARPQDVVALRKEMKFDQPWPVQYWTWLQHIVRGDFGTSLLHHGPVSHEVWKRVPVTLELLILGMLLTVLIGVPSGIVSAVKQDSALDYVARTINVLMLAIPGFWLATLLLLLPSLWWHYAPPVGYVAIWKNPSTNLQQFYMPAIALAAAAAAAIMRMTRSAVLEVMRSDYVRTARAKGLQQRVVLVRHVLKSSFIPVLSLLGLQAAVLIGGQVIIEQIFTLPGVGQLLVEGVVLRDYAVVQMIVLLIATAVLLINLATDLGYAFLDPRISYT
jgi:peptide/nickel transport system permease protein